MLATGTASQVDNRCEIFDYVSDRESNARTYASAIGRTLEKGYLSRVYDTNGRDYLDCLACAGTLATGHNHPRINMTILDFLKSGQIMQSLDITTPTKHAFVRRLFSTLPEAFAERAKIQFCGPTGSDAVEAALKLFKTVTGRRTILAFHGAYHGMTAGSLALTGNLTAKTAVAGLMPDVHFLPYPYPYRCPFGIGGDKSYQVSLQYIERLLRDPESGIPLPAALLVEAVQGEGGVIPAPQEWLIGLRRITSDLGIPLVIDEIQTGFGRTGKMFAFEHSGITPDAIVISKAIGGGFPLSALLYHEQYDTWAPGAHAGTFRGNQIAMAAGTTTLDIIESEKLVEGASRKGQILCKELHNLARRYSCIGDVRGKGLMWGMEIVEVGSSRDHLGSYPADGALARKIKNRCLENGLLIERGGRFGAVLRLLPALVITEDEIAELIAKLDASISECITP
jgi:diaminobutyrate-2-oxoglutarate transaminase